MTPTEEMLTKIAEAWRGWLLAIEGLPEERVDEPGVCGDWSVKDLVPHMALWDLVAVVDVDRHLAGLPALEDDVQVMNEEWARRSRPDPYWVQLIEMHDAHRRLVHAVRDLDGATGPIDPEMLADDTWEHYPEHTAQVLAWRDANGLG